MNPFHLKSITFAGLMLSAQLVKALPLPIRSGVLIGPLNANRQAVTNVSAVAFADGTMLTTAGSGVVTGTNAAASLFLPGASAPGTGLLYDEPGAPCGVTLTVILTGAGTTGNPLTAGFKTQGCGLVCDDPGQPGQILSFDP